MSTERATLIAAIWCALTLSCSDGEEDAAVDDLLAMDPPSGCDATDAFDEAAMKADLVYLASPALDGRVPGSAGDVAARKVIAERFACLELTRLGTSASYEQPFTDSEGRSTANVIAAIPGGDDSVSSEMVVVSAHSDHLGGGKLGANDNASGLAALMAIAQTLQSGLTKPRRTVVLAAFGSEESGYEGSAYFLAHPPAGVDPSKVVYNVNMDMIGSYSAATIVYALGTFDGTPGRSTVASSASQHPNISVGLGDPSDLSDNASFCERGIPYIFFWTEDSDPNTKSTDSQKFMRVQN